MARMLAFPPGSHTSFEPQCVVAVMGKAHVRGVAYSIEQDLREGARQVGGRAGWGCMVGRAGMVGGGWWCAGA